MLMEITGSGGSWRDRDEEARSRVCAARERTRVVVVVDDEPSIQEVVSMILENEGGYDVRCASNGEEALQLLAQMPIPDLLVVDIMMPVMDGWGLITALRVNERTARIPVIVSSASSSHDAVAMGVERFLPKPIDYDAFLAAVDEITRRRDREIHEAAAAVEI